MEHTSPEAIRNQVKIYIAVFAALAVLTAVTVAVSYLHLPFRRALAVALAVAAIKASLVAAFFMHLISEKAIIYWILGLALLFFAVLLVLPSY